MQKWEYLNISRARGTQGRKNGMRFHMGGEWVNEIQTSRGDRDFKYKDLTEAMAKLGEEGWELVAISPRSGLLGGTNIQSGNGVSTDYAGFTSEEIWVFKRPKE